MAFENAFRCETQHLEIAAVFTGTISSDLADKPLCVMSPDPGGIKRAQFFREALETKLGVQVDFALCNKRRSGGGRASGAIVGDVAGTRMIIVDDMIVSGGTILSAARAARRNGAHGCMAVAAHGLFAEGSDTLFDAPELLRVLVCDSVPTARNTNAQLVSTVPVLALAIRELARD